MALEISQNSRYSSVMTATKKKVLYKKIGEQIKKKRGRKTQQWLSDECGKQGYPINRNTIAKIETGLRKLSAVELFVIARVIGGGINLLFPQRFLEL